MISVTLYSACAVPHSLASSFLSPLHLIALAGGGGIRVLVSQGLRLHRRVGQWQSPLAAERRGAPPAVAWRAGPAGCAVNSWRSTARWRRPRSRYRRATATVIAQRGLRSTQHAPAAARGAAGRAAGSAVPRPEWTAAALRWRSSPPRKGAATAACYHAASEERRAAKHQQDDGED